MPGVTFLEHVFISVFERNPQYISAILIKHSEMFLLMTILTFNSLTRLIILVFSLSSGASRSGPWT